MEPYLHILTITLRVLILALMYSPRPTKIMERFTRRRLIKRLLAVVSAMTGSFSELRGRPLTNTRIKNRNRVRMGEEGWPNAEEWTWLQSQLTGKLVKVVSPFSVNITPDESLKLFEKIKNPYFNGDNVEFTQTVGWHHAWKNEQSGYAVVAANAQDVAHAVNFARHKNLRLVVKGGGHSYQGTSCSKDSLLIWTRQMNNIVVDEHYEYQSTDGKRLKCPAVHVGAGAIWMHVYDQVTTKSGWYVQGGGCATVGVAGLIQSGGFGSLSKTYGIAAAGLLEAEVVTADGQIRIVNSNTHSDLFWSLKGGGGGSFAVITKMTLKLHPLPQHVGVVFGAISADSDGAFQDLIGYLFEFYSSYLFNSFWGEQIRFTSDNSAVINMMFTGLSEADAIALWAPCVEFVKNRTDLHFTQELQIHELPARKLWDPGFFNSVAPNLIVKDDRPGASEKNIFWIGDKEESGQYLFGYHSFWLDEALLDKKSELSLAIFAATRSWSVAIHFNKGLAGSERPNIDGALNTAMNSSVVNAFALAIIAGGESSIDPNFKDDPLNSRAQKIKQKIDGAAMKVESLCRAPGSYVSESNYFLRDWQAAYWGKNYVRLRAIKKRYDPDGLFFVHHGVGTETWSEDGFTCHHTKQ